MAYDETTYRRDSGGEPSGPSAYRAGASGGFAGGLDDPMARQTEPVDTYRESWEREPARDRMGVHIGWEIVLLLAVAALAFLLFRLDPASVRRPALDALLISGATVGLLALGAGLSMRTGVPNLAIGPVALAAAFQYAENGDQGIITAAVPALGIAVAGGVVVALLVLILHVPGWAASLAASLGVIVFIQLRTAPVDVQGTMDPADYAFYLFGGFALLAVFGGALGAAGPLRRFVGRMRPHGDPAARPARAAVLPVLFALITSSVFAVVAGFLTAAQATGPVVPGTGLEWTGLGFGAALLAGTSAYGRRGGIFGTLLAVVAVVLFIDYAARRDLQIAIFAVAAVTVAAGLVVTRLVETYGKPVGADYDDDWNVAPSVGVGHRAPDLPEAWTPPSAAPAQQRGSEQWELGPWGSGR
jgi:hypothetical protein